MAKREATRTAETKPALIAYRATASHHDRLRKAAKLKGKSLSEFVRSAVEFILQAEPVDEAATKRRGKGRR